MVIFNQETLSRPGPHPHRSARTSFGPTNHHQTTTIAEKGVSVADQYPVEKHDVSAPDLAGTTTVSGGIAMKHFREWIVHDRRRDRPACRSNGQMLWTTSSWMRLSCRFREQDTHWFLEGWIGDHSVDILVDSGSAVTALSCSFYQTLVRAGAPVGALQATPRKLRGANGSSIEILGCSSCVVSFLGLQTEFPILVCDLSADIIIGTDTLGSVLPHTLDIKNGLLFTEGGGGCITSVASQRRHIAPHVRWVAGRCHPAAFWRA